MKDRILQFLTSERISPAEFADKIGVQRSSMSHILNGRNYPSASFIQRMLRAYPLVNPRWLMIGEGPMNIGMPDKEEITIASPGPFFNSSNQTAQNTNLDRESGMHLFPEKEIASGRLTTNILAIEQDQTEAKNTPKTSPVNSVGSQILKEEEEAPKGGQGSNLSPLLSAYQSGEKEVEQVLFFYKDKTFMVYRPS